MYRRQITGVRTSFIPYAASCLRSASVEILTQQPSIAIDDNLQITSLNTNLLIGFLSIVVGILVGMFFLARARTRQKRDAEAFLASLLNTTLSGIMCLKAIREKERIVDFEITFANNTILRFLQITEGDALHKHILQVNPSIKDQGIFEKYIEVTESGKSTKFERVIGKQHLSVLLARFNDGVTASFYNITDLKMTEFQLNTKIRELEQTNLELEQIAYVTSHDLQEPLRKIHLFADMIQHASSEKEKQIHLAAIIKNASRMRTLILKLSEYTKVHSSASQFHPVDLNEIIRDVIIVYEDLMRECNLSIQCVRLPVIEGIPHQLYTLFDNLVNNSIKFSRKNTACVIHVSVKRPGEQMTVENFNPHLEYVDILFKDNGAGFDQSYARKIFKLFQQLERKDDGQDVGMGLALCLKIARSHQGDIFVVSTVDEGSEFHIVLPIRQGNGSVSH